MTLRSDLKSRLVAGETIVAPGAYDPMSARVVQSLGFDTVYVGGYMSGAHLAVTEPLMTLTEQVEVAERVAKSVPLPVVCDAGAGYGDPVHTMHTVRTFERAGICGIHIEDQVFPKRASYHAGLEHVIPIDEFLEKMQYALEARSDPDFLIIGRTDSFTDFAMPPKSAGKSTSWKASRPRAARATWPANRTSGVESCCATWTPALALAAPGPRVTNTTGSSGELGVRLRHHGRPALLACDDGLDGGVAHASSTAR